MKKNIIGFYTGFPNFEIARQTPKSKGIWGEYKFYCDQKIDECGWLVVFDDVDAPVKTSCDPRKTILITGEPETIKNYSKKFTDQFAYVITSNRKMKHENVFYMQQGLPWMIGIRFENGAYVPPPRLNYDSLSEMKRPRKTKLMSVIVSSKQRTPGHKQRLLFIEELRKEFEDEIDIYGSGHNHIPDKKDAIIPYKYHIVLENSSLPDYWSEKLADAYLGFSYPFYWGCTNIDKYFPKSVYVPIDIYDSQKAIRKIKLTIKRDEYNLRKNDITKARDLVLNKYNIFSMIDDFINTQRVDSSNKEMVTIYPQSHYKSNNLISKIRSKFVNIIK